MVDGTVLRGSVSRLLALSAEVKVENGELVTVAEEWHQSYD